MAWSRSPDPFENRRRKLAEQERRLANERKKLHAELAQSDPPATANGKRGEPPVWRLEDEMPPRRAAPTPSRKRHLARQRRRDLVVFLLCVIVLLLVGIVVLWVASVHYPAASNST